MLRKSESDNDRRTHTSKADGDHEDIGPVSLPRRSGNYSIPSTSPASATQTVNRGLPVEHTEATMSQAGVMPSRQASPGDRFRAAVRKVVKMHQVSNRMTGASIIVGAEPGIDPRRQSAFHHYGHINQNCVIEIVDYSRTNTSSGKMTNSEFVELLDNPEACKRDSWVKVRWINVGGISWDVMSALAIKYDLHPLALEDVLHQRKHASSKAEYFLQHLFLRIVCHTISPDEETYDRSAITSLPRSSSPTRMSNSLDEKHNGFVETDIQCLQPGIDYGTAASKARQNKDTLQADRVTTEELKRDGGINVKVEPMSIFLLRDGTVISISPTPNLDFTAPVTARLRLLDTTLRISADASLLVQSLIDLIVDRALEVIDEYQGRLLELERQVLIKPKMRTVKHLHLISGSLTLHKRTLAPIRTVIYGLRRYDVDRSTALRDLFGSGNNNNATVDTEIQGYMSHKAKIYLADVFDHMEHIMTSLEMFENIAENLIDYTFNLSSAQMNQVMRQLTLATVILLPMTFLTGYCGMNFQYFHIKETSDVYFWKIAIPMMAVVLFIFMWSDVKKAVHYFFEKQDLSRHNRNYISRGR